MKKNKKIQHYIEYISLVSFMALLHLLPVSAARKISVLFAKTAFTFIPIRKKHIIDSLSAAFPDKKQDEIINIAKDVYIRFANTIVEIMFFKKMSKQQLKEMVNFQNLYLLEKAKKDGKGAILLSAHFGNWELLAISFAQRAPLSVIVAQQENLLVDKLIDDIRSGKGYKTIYKDNMAFKWVLKALKRNEFVAILADQDAGRQGVFVPFFGRYASTAKGPAVFALRAGCPVYASFCSRQKDGRYIATFQEIEKPDTGDEEKDIEIIMSKYSEILQENIERNPSSWFWFHRRWKTKKQ
ncbi:MAG: lysophospholipid acyltransferase family protein [Endomicrobiaceae bacterium]|jgi:KDO2-lipid IV(A) lauroyltransferase|nr:lysophospholipid acyltransferase family protein [Endomicrobiaceae bacterium]